MEPWELVALFLLSLSDFPKKNILEKLPFEMIDEKKRAGCKKVGLESY